jgi:hypothetical protein
MPPGASENPREGRFLSDSSGLLVLGQIGFTFITGDFIATGRVEAVFTGAIMIGLATLALCFSLASTASRKGYSRLFGLLGLVSLPGALAVGCLPDLRARERPHGFDVITHDEKSR